MSQSALYGLIFLNAGKAQINPNNSGVGSQ